jgi:hypothetical protein
VSQVAILIVARHHPDCRATAAVLAELDARGAPDADYKAGLSTWTKDPLKQGETWRGRLVKVAQGQQEGAASANPALGALNKIADLMAAQQSAKAQALRGALEQHLGETLPTGPTVGMADALGVPVRAVVGAIKELATHGVISKEDATRFLSDQPIPRGEFQALTGALRLKLTGGGGSDAAPASGVRNPLSYKANLDQEAHIANNIVTQHPELAGAVNAIRDPGTNGKTKQGRAAVLEGILAATPPEQRQAVADTLRPLTGFGKGDPIPLVRAKAPRTARATQK